LPSQKQEATQGLRKLSPGRPTGDEAEIDARATIAILGASTMPEGAYQLFSMLTWCL
jgi:hypothetical protein